MPILASAFAPPGWLSNGHAQTVVAALWPRRVVYPVTQERLELADGDFLDLHWTRAGRERLVIITHGLEGSATNGSIRGLSAALRAAGWDVLAWDFRGCGRELNRRLRFYHSGETGDLAAVIAEAARDYAQIALVGFSLGGNVILKYLGEAPPDPRVVGAVAISAPIDLAASARELDARWINRIYVRRFVQSLVKKVEAKAPRFPGELAVTGARDLRTLREFDDRYTAPLHGFRDAEDYWQQSSSRQFLARIRVPTLLLNARDDPFLAPECFPEGEAAVSRWLTLEAPAHGGHVGFLRFSPGAEFWLERRVVEFLASWPAGAKTGLPREEAGVPTAAERRFRGRGGGR